MKIPLTVTQLLVMIRHYCAVLLAGKNGRNKSSFSASLSGITLTHYWRLRIISLLLGFSSCLLADPVRVTYVSTKLTSINHDDVNYIISHAQRYFKPLHMIVRMRQVYIDKTLCPNGEGSERTQEIKCLDFYAERHFKRKKTIIYNFLTPGWADKYRHYYGGVALATCTNTILNTADTDMYGSYENSLDASKEIGFYGKKTEKVKAGDL